MGRQTDNNVIIIHSAFVVVVMRFPSISLTFIHFLGTHIITLLLLIALFTVVSSASSLPGLRSPSFCLFDRFVMNVAGVFVVYHSLMYKYHDDLVSFVCALLIIIIIVLLSFEKWL